MYWKTALLLLATGLGSLISPIWVAAQHPEIMPKTVTLLARREVGGRDNYTEAAFSFKHGINGEEALKLTRNNWDILFDNNSPDMFDVTMVVDDCSRIKDLGELSWFDTFEIPVLTPHPEPAREPGVKAIVGHMYLVHSKDTDSDHYALFRVEHLESRETVTISWKLIPAPVLRSVENENQIGARVELILYGGFEFGDDLSNLRGVGRPGQIL